MVSFGMEDFSKRYGDLKPSQFVDVVSLVGDRCDNIPEMERMERRIIKDLGLSDEEVGFGCEEWDLGRVDGIGNVHAVQLITKFTLENLLKCVDEVEVDHIRKALIANADQAVLSKNLAMLRCDLPFYMVPFSTRDLTFNKPEDNGEKFTSLLNAISAYAEGFSADPIIRRAFYLWKKLEPP
ncbi:hypothetical protein GOBAR_DD36856 [Gossypium barbadense]|nr:hypothetical protein GOBAR_DD36856 [Gossypium barbadense]